MTNILSKSAKAALGLVAVAALVAGANFANATTYNFATNLKQGMTSPDVKALQMCLNTMTSTPVTTSGVGSAGYETSYFGGLTFKAVVAFQNANPDILSTAGLTSGNGFVGALTRAKLNVVCNGTTPPPQQPPQTGPVSVMLSTNNPASTTFVGGQATADLAHFTFSGTGVVTNVTLKRIGVSADSTASNVYLFDGATRLTDAASVTNGSMISFNNGAGLFMVGGSKTVSVKSDLASVSGQTIGVQLVSYTVSGASATTVNLMGNLHSIATATLAQVSAGTVTPTGSTINPGAAQTLWQSTLTITQRDVLLKRMAFRQVGSAPANSMMNFKLMVNGSQVGSTVASLDSMGYVTFDLSSTPVTLPAGSRIVRVDADVVSGASRTIQLSLRQAADIDLVDSNYGVNITPSGTPWVAASALTIAGASGGTMIISKDTTLASANVTNNASDVEIGRFTAQAFGESMKIETFKVAFGSSDATVNSLRNGRVLVNGVQYGSTASLLTCDDVNNDGACTGADTAGAGTAFTLNYVVMPGSPVTISVHADTYDDDGTNNMSNSDTIFAAIAIGSSNVVRQDSLGYVSVPSAIVTGQTMTNTTAVASLLKNTGYADQTINIPQTAYKLGSWNVSAGSAEDLNVNTFSVDVTSVIGATFSNADLTNVYFKYGNGLSMATTPLATVSATSNQYSVSFTIPKGTSSSIEMYGNVLSGSITATHSVKATLTVTGTSAVSGTSVPTSAVDGQITAYNTGSLTVSKDGSSPLNRIVAGNQEVTAGVYKFQASNDNFTVSRIDVSVADATTASAVSAVKLYDGATLVGQLGFTGDDADSGTSNMASFTGLSWAIPSNTSKYLTVKFMLNNIGTGAGTSQKNAVVQLDQVSYQDSTGTVTPLLTDYNANELYVYKTIPTFTVGTVPSGTLVNNVARDLYKFTVGASSQGSVAIKQLKLPVTWSDGGGGTDTLSLQSWKIYQDNSDVTSTVTLQNELAASIEGATGMVDGTNTTVVATWPAGSELIIPAGGSVEIKLKATPVGFNTTDASQVTAPDSVSLYLAGDSAHNSTKVYLNDGTATAAIAKLWSAAAAANAGATTYNVLWSDNSSSTHSDTTNATSSGDWANGYKALNLDLDPVGWTD